MKQDHTWHSIIEIRPDARRLQRIRGPGNSIWSFDARGANPTSRAERDLEVSERWDSSGLRLTRAKEARNAQKRRCRAEAAEPNAQGVAATDGMLVITHGSSNCRPNRSSKSLPGTAERNSRKVVSMMTHARRS